jgi:hypothetical protein
MAAQAARVGLSGGRDRLDAVGDLPFRDFSNWVVCAALGNRRRLDPGV